MHTIINSIIGQTSDELLDYLLMSQDLLSPQEISYLEYVKECHTNTGTFPSLTLIQSQFPEVQQTKTFTGSDLNNYIESFLNKRRNLSVSQKLLKAANEVSQNGLTSDVLDVISTLAPTQSTHKDILDTPDSFLEYYNDKKSKPQGIVTNIKAVDNVIHGLPYGNVLTLFGYVASFKSMLVNNIAYHNAMNLKYNICILSLEVPKGQLMANFITRHSTNPQFDVTYLDNSKVRTATLDENEFQIMTDVLNEFYDYQNHGFIKVYDESDFTTMSFQEIRKLLVDADDECVRRTGYPLDLVIVDHINLLKFNGAGSKLSTTEQGNQYVSFFHKIAQAFRKKSDGSFSELMVILLAQANRTGWKKAVKNKGAYTLDALSEFNELERASQIVMSVYTNDEMKVAHEATVQVLKNRFGPTIEEPQSVYVAPEAYTMGDEMEGFNESLDMNEMEDIFAGGLDSILNM